MFTLCVRDYIQLEVAPSDTDRGHSLIRQLTSNIILWDGSVEPGHVYHAMNDRVKVTKKHVIISRTPLPLNVLAHNQCAPIHGDHFENDLLNEWLEQWLHRYIMGNAYKGSAVSASVVYTKKKLAEHYWLFDHPANIFLSLRGSQLKEAQDWSRQFAAKTRQSVRIVPQQQYAYETECVTRQQMWQVVAGLNREMRATNRRVIFLSKDYFSSFWTCSELLSLIRWPRNSDSNCINGAYFVLDHSSIELHPLEIGTQTLPMPRLSKQQANRFWHILNNSDLMTSAPDTQIPPSSFAKGLAPLLRPFNADFTGPDFWQMIRVPCLHCSPKGRTPDQIDWDAHLQFKIGNTIDFYGYFSVYPEEPQMGNVQCPQCLKRINLKNVRSPRTLWVPLMTTEKDQTRPVIFEQTFWEVSEE